MLKNQEMLLMSKGVYQNNRHEKAKYIKRLNKKKEKGVKSYPRHAIINCQHRVDASTGAVQIHLPKYRTWSKTY